MLSRGRRPKIPCPARAGRPPGVRRLGRGACFPSGAWQAPGVPRPATPWALPWAGIPRPFGALDLGAGRVPRFPDIPEGAQCPATSQQSPAPDPLVASPAFRATLPVVAPSFLHELLVDLFRQRPDLGPALLHALRVPIPEGKATLGSVDLSNVAPVCLSADAVVHTGTPAGFEIREPSFSTCPVVHHSGPLARFGCFVRSRPRRGPCPVLRAPARRMRPGPATWPMAATGRWTSSGDRSAAGRGTP